MTVFAIPWSLPKVFHIQPEPAARPAGLLTTHTTLDRLSEETRTRVSSSRLGKEGREELPGLGTEMYESEEDARTSVTSLDPGTLWWRETILTTSYRLSLVDRHGIFDLGTIGNIREPSRIFPNCFPRWRRLLPKVLASLNFLGFKIWQFINIRAGNIKVFS